MTGRQITTRHDGRSRLGKIRMTHFITSAPGGGGDRKAISLRAGLHFCQRHLGAPGARGQPGGGRGGPQRPVPRRGARRSAARVRGASEPGPRAAAGRTPRAPALPRRCLPAGREHKVLGRVRWPPSEGTKAPGPMCAPGWGRGLEGGPGAEALAGSYLCFGGGGGAEGGRWSRRAPPRGPPALTCRAGEGSAARGVSSRPRVPPAARAGLGVHGALLAHLPLSCSRGPH